MRGPIASPALRCLLLTPISPHMLFDRTLVLAEHEELDFVVAGAREAVCTMDGRHVSVLEPGDRVTCRAAARTTAPRATAVARLPPDPQGEVRPPGPLMLHELRVENLGIIEEILVPLGPGMTVITGETGAGKTLLVDALELLCGGRADPTAVRDGAEEARVEGRFTLAGSDDPDEVVLARVIPVVGRSRGYVNGRLATASELADLGRRLVDLHGQHAHQSLLAPVEQRALLDRACGAARRGHARASARRAPRGASHR